MRRTIAPPLDLPRPTPNPEQIADPWREVVDPGGRRHLHVVSK